MLQKTSYLLLDAARMEATMEEAKARNKSHDSLYRGISETMLSGVAPYIFRFDYAASFSNWYLKTGWGDSWGILVKSSWPMTELHKHFRKFLLVKTEDGRELYFRFYDPRVLRIFLPTCDPLQLREFFGEAIDYFIVEDEDPAYALRFYQQNGLLQTERLPVEEQIAQLAAPEALPPPAEEPLLPETIAAMQAAQQGAPAPAQESAAPQPPAAPAVPQPPKAAPPPPVPVSSEPAVRKGPKSKWEMFD